MRPANSAHPITLSSVIRRSRSMSHLMFPAGTAPRLFAAALLATTALSLPSVVAAATPAPRFTSVDDHGVDLVLGQPFFTMDEGGIGSGSGAIRMERIYAAGAGWTDNWSGGLYVATVGGVTKTYVQIGGISDTFTQSGGVYTSENQQGSTLVTIAGGNLLYTAADGTTINFYPDNGTPVIYTCPGASAGSCQIPTEITRPNGFKFRLTWNAWRECVTAPPPGESCIDSQVYRRLNTVTSSAGYSLNVAYAADTPPGAYIYASPSDDWFRRTGVSFNNSVNPPSPAPAIAYANPSSTVTNVTDPGGRTWVLTTDATGRLTGVRRPGSPSDNIAFAYDATSGLVSSATKDGVTNAYTVPLTNQYKVTDPMGHATTVTADAATGRPASVKDAVNQTVSYLYDSNARIQRVTQPEGNYTTYGYDARGNATTITNVAKWGSGLANIVTSAAYPSSCTNPVTCNKPTSTTDAKGFVTDYTFDSTHGGILTVTRPAPATGQARPQSRYSYTAVQGGTDPVLYPPVNMLSNVAACANGSSCTTAAEIKQSATYNANLLPITVSKGNTAGTLSATSTIAYDGRGNVDTVDGPQTGTADTARFIYDSADQRIGTISPDPDGAGTLTMRAVRLSYRPDGQVSKRELGNVTAQTSAALSAMSALQTLDVGFDLNSRAITQQLSAGGTAYALAQTSYDADGRANCAATRMNTAVYGSLPASACTLSTQATGGSPDQITSLTYDAADRVTVRTIGYATADAAAERTLAYSANGQVASLIDANVNKTTYVYDGFDRLSQTQYPSATKGSGTSNASDYEQLGYDASSNVISRRLRDATSIAYTYDNLDRATFKDLPGTEPDVTYTYDNLGRVTAASQTGNALSFSYDALSRMLTQGGPQGTSTSDYDIAGRRIKLTYPGTGLYVNYDWLVTGEISKIRENGATTGTGVLATYTYDNLGNMTTKAFGNGAAQTYAFDAISRLKTLTNDLGGSSDDLTIGGTTTPVTYNPGSQITSLKRTGNSYPYTAFGNVDRDYVTNGLNQYNSSTAGGLNTTYIHDARGNLTSDGTNGFTYTSENLLKTGPNGSTLTYDPALRLYQLVSGSATTRWAYDGLNMIAEYNGSNAILRSHVFAPGVDAPIVTYEGSAISNTTRRYLSADERGSIIAVSGASAIKIATNGYDEYGIPQSPASSTAGTTGQGTINGRFGYTGQAWLSEVGVYYYKARMYSPTLGRFMQTDPIRTSGGINFYTYVANDPVNFRDPSGKCPYGQGIAIGDWQTGYDIICPVLENGATLANRVPDSNLKSNESGTGGDTDFDGEDDSEKPEYCASQAYQAGQRLKALGSGFQFAGLTVGAYGVGEAIFLGTMTGGPGATAALPTIGLGAELYSAGGAGVTLGNALECSGGSSGSCSKSVEGIISMAFSFASPLGTAANFASDLTSDLAINKVNDKVLGEEDPCL